MPWEDPGGGVRDLLCLPWLPPWHPQAGQNQTPNPGETRSQHQVSFLPWGSTDPQALRGSLLGRGFSWD